MAVLQRGQPAGVGSDSSGMDLVQAINASSTFSKSPALRKLLLYLWEHRDAALSEYAIAVDIFAKPPSFDPRSDATVRVQISRLRQKLKEYFESEGAHHPARLKVPQGSHRLELRAVTPAVRNDDLLPRLRPLFLPAIAVCVTLLVGILAFQNYRLRSDLARSVRSTELPDLWRAMLRPGRVTRVVYPIPVVYSWDKLRVRDVTINEPEGWRASPHLKPFVELYGEPTLSESYSVASDTSAAIQLTRFLSGRGVPLEVTPTASLSLDRFGNENLVFLGITPTNAELDKYTGRTNFFLFPGQSSVGNRKPLPGERAVFRESPLGGTRRTTYGLIAVLPGPAADAGIILLMGLQTASLATFLTSPATLSGFEQQWRQAGAPQHFEVVVQVDSDRGQTKAARSVAFRRLT